MGLFAFLRKMVGLGIYKENASGEDLIRFLRAHGAEIGDNVRIYAANKTLIDKTSPWLLTIGDRVRIAEGVKILTHDYSWSVLKCYSGEEIQPGSILGAQRPVTIGNNVFIGVNAVILPGVVIGDNVVIGAGSIVRKDCEANSVYAGNPARRVSSIEDFYHKRKQQQFLEAKELALRYRERFGKAPTRDIFHEYFMLFSTPEVAKAVDAFRSQMKTSGNLEECALYMEQHTPLFESFEAFLEACYLERTDGNNR